MHLVITYKNFSLDPSISHVGLGIAAINTAKVLRRCGIKVSVIPLRKEADFLESLRADSSITHYVISAPWISSPVIQDAINQFPDVQFAVNCHSNVGFLQADTFGVKLLREYMDIEKGTQNFCVAGNSKKFCRWVNRAYSSECLYLPNAYYLDQHSRSNRPVFSGGVLRIGAFGAIRAEKNFMSAAGAVLEMANDLKVDTELWVSSGGPEGVNYILNSMHALLDNIPGIKIVNSHWSSWPEFRRIVGSMNLLLQVSYTESFNMVTADGIAQGVPTVVSDAIDWVPAHWQAFMDDVNDIARAGERLLHDVRAPHDGLVHLERHNADAVKAWLRFLGIYKEHYRAQVADIDTNF